MNRSPRLSAALVCLATIAFVCTPNGAPRASSQGIQERTPPPDLNGEWRTTTSAAEPDRILIRQLGPDITGIQISGRAGVPQGEIRFHSGAYAGDLPTIDEICDQSAAHPGRAAHSTIHILDATHIRFEGGCSSNSTWSRFGPETISLDASDLFQFNSSAWTTAAPQILDRLLVTLEVHSPKSLTILGFTDNLGTSQHNTQLSTRRARALAAWLETRHKWQFPITAKGMGSQNPRWPNTTEQGRTRNRRIEIVLTQ